MDILQKINPSFDRKIKALINSFTDKFLSDFTLDLFLRLLENRLPDIKAKKIGELVSSMDENTFLTIKSVLIKKYQSFVPKIAPKILTAFNIPEIVEERINSFSTQYTEELIVSIADKELKAITYVGGILGFIIGLIPVVINLIA